MTFILNKKVWLTLLLLISMGVAGFATYEFVTTSQLNTAQASTEQTQETGEKPLTEDEKIKKRVKENPDAGLEAIDSETLEQSKYFIKTLPRFITEKEIDSQLKDGYITEKQHQEFIKLIDEKEGK